MGHTTAKVTLHGTLEDRSEQVELLVDTGSTYTWVSSSVLKRLGVEGKVQRKFRTIDGRLLDRKVGEVVIEHMQEKATRLVVFAEKGDAQVLGVDALEGLGLEVDPVARKLRKVEAFLAL